MSNSKIITSDAFIANMIAKGIKPSKICLYDLVTLKLEFNQLMEQIEFWVANDITYDFELTDLLRMMRQAFKSCLLELRLHHEVGESFALPQAESTETPSFYESALSSTRPSPPPSGSRNHTQKVARTSCQVQQQQNYLHQNRSQQAPVQILITPPTVHNQSQQDRANNRRSINHLTPRHTPPNQNVSRRAKSPLRTIEFNEGIRSRQQDHWTQSPQTIFRHRRKSPFFSPDSKDNISTAQTTPQPRNAMKAHVDTPAPFARRKRAREDYSQEFVAIDSLNRSINDLMHVTAAGDQNPPQSTSSRRQTSNNTHRQVLNEFDPHRGQ